MDNIKGVLFDKDGTLIEFFSLWEKIAFGLVNDLVTEEDQMFKQKLLASIGFVNGQITANSILAGGTTKDIANAFYPLLRRENRRIPEPFHQWVEKRILQLTKEHLQVIQPITDLKKLLKQLKDNGLKLGVATADDQETTTLTFQMLGIDHYFDFIGTSDYYEKKPNPKMMDAFCQQVGLTPKEVVMVGDTAVDIAFAKNAECALSIGVSSGASEKKELADADIVIPSVKFLLDQNNQFVWEND